MIELRHITKTFQVDGAPFNALSDINLAIGDGDIFGIIGMSGAGKSTLVRCLNMLERPTSGQVVIDGQDIGTLKGEGLRALRRQVTMIFQGFNLLMQSTCLDNVCFPLSLAGVPRRQAAKRALELLETVGLGHKASAYPAQLSGGQQQRVAIARALATNPKVLLCDEATSALDPTTTHSILELIREINAKTGITVVVITHQMSVVESICRHVAILEAGKVVESGAVDTIFSNPRSEAARKLVYPDGYSESLVFGGANEHLLQVVFDGALASAKPIIAMMARETGIDANIAYASTRSIGGKAFGSMLLGIAGGSDRVAAAIEYISRTPDVHVKEVHPDA